MEFEFDLDNAIDTLDNVPDELKPFYAKGNDGYRVNDAMKGAAKRLNSLQTNLKSERSKKTEAGNDAAKHRNAAKGYTDLVAAIADLDADNKTPEGLKNYIDGLVAKAAQGGKKGEDAAKQLEAIKTEMAKDKATALAAKDQEITGLRGSLNRYMIGEQANAALAEKKGNPLFLRPLIDRHTRVTKHGEDYVVEVVNEKGEVRYNGEGNPMTIGQLVEEMSKDAKFAGAFEGRVQGGGGTNGTKPTDKKQADRNTVPEGKDKGKAMIANGIRARQAARR